MLKCAVIDGLPKTGTGCHGFRRCRDRDFCLQALVRNGCAQQRRLAFSVYHCCVWFRLSQEVYQPSESIRLVPAIDRFNKHFAVYSLNRHRQRHIRAVSAEFDSGEQFTVKF